TGRKIVVDSYGSACAHGGGAFSGKDATKVDRSGAYMARCLARHVVAVEIAPRCTVQIAYAIGVAQPIALNVDVHGWRDVDEDALALRRNNGFSNRSVSVASSLPYTTGAMVTAARYVLENGGVACAPCSGFHHAGFDRPSGYCTFNGLVVTAMKLKKEGRV